MKIENNLAKGRNKSFCRPPNVQFAEMNFEGIK